MHYNDQGADFKYLIVNERDKRFGLSVTTVGFQAIRAGSVLSTTQPPGRLLFHSPRKDVCCMNISWYISLKDEELSPATQPLCRHIQRADTFPVSRTVAYLCTAAKDRMERILHRFEARL